MIIFDSIIYDHKTYFGKMSLFGKQIWLLSLSIYHLCHKWFQAIWMFFFGKSFNALKWSIFWQSLLYFGFPEIVGTKNGGCMKFIDKIIKPHQVPWLVPIGAKVRGHSQSTKWIIIYFIFACHEYQQRLNLFCQHFR